LKIDSFVAQIIKAPNVDHFTPSDVRSAYLALKNDPTLDPVVVRRKVYGELLKLEKKGWLKKLISSKKGVTRFNKTALFIASELLTKESVDTTAVKSTEADKHKNLVIKLNHYKADLLLNIGETEAYKELYSEFPDLVDEIQPQFNEAKDNNTRILGKIKAIEGLLKLNNTVEKI
jgi:ribosomal protein L17